MKQKKETNPLIYHCKSCGKEIDLTPYVDYTYTRTYKGHKVYFCGFNCRNKWDAQVPTRRILSRRGKDD